MDIKIILKHACRTHLYYSKKKKETVICTNRYPGNATQPAAPCRMCLPFPLRCSPCSPLSPDLLQFLAARLPHAASNGSPRLQLAPPIPQQARQASRHIKLKRRDMWAASYCRHATTPRQKRSRSFTVPHQSTNREAYVSLE